MEANKTNQIIRIVLICFSVLVTGFTSGWEQQRSPLSFPEGQIAYIAYDGNIFVVSPGKRAEQLTMDAGRFEYLSPKFSPDGSMLGFFIRDDEVSASAFDLAIMTISNKKMEILVENVDPWGGFDWRNDSRSVAFGYSLDVSCQSPNKDTATGIYEVDLKSGVINSLVDVKIPSHPYKNPVYSADDKWIMFQEYPCFSEGSLAYTANLRTGTTINFDTDSLTWHPSAERLIWSQDAQAYNPAGVYLVRPDGTGATFLYASNDLASTNPSISPDGNWMVLRQHTQVEGFFFTPEETSDWTDMLVLVNINTSKVIEVCQSEVIAGCKFVAWSPGSKALVYSKEQDSGLQHNLYLISSLSSSILAEVGPGGLDWR